MELKFIIREVAKKLNLSYAQLSNELHCNENRIKQIAAGNIKNFKSEEIDILVNKFKLNKLWLLTGEGEMFASKGNSQTLNNSPGAQQANGSITGNSADTATNKNIIDDEEVQELCFGIYSFAKSIKKIEELKTYLKQAPSRIMSNE